MVEFITPKVGVQARQAGQVSTAPARNLARAASATKMAADTFSQYYEEQAAIENELILATTQADWTQTYNERKGSAGDGFTKGMLADYDTYVAAAMADSPKRGREQLQLAMDKYRLNIETKSMQQEAAARAKAKAAAIAEANRLKANALISDPSLLDDYLEGAGPKETSLFVRMALSGRMPNDPQGVHDDVMGGKWDSVLTPEQKISARNQAQTGIDRIEKERETEIKVEQGLYLDRMQEELDHVVATGGLPLDSELDNDTIKAMFSDDPDKAAELIRMRDISVQHAQDMNAVSTASSEDWTAELQRLDAEVREFGDAKGDQARLSSYAAAVLATQNSIETDAASHVQKNTDMASVLWKAYNEAEDPETKAAALNRYSASLNTTYNIMGVDQKFRNMMPKPYAKQMVAQFNDRNADTAVQALAGFLKDWGDDTPRIKAELREAGLVSEYGSATRHLGDPAMVARIAGLRDITEVSLKENLPTLDVTEANKTFDEIAPEYMSAFISGNFTDQALTTFNAEVSIAKRLALQDIATGTEPKIAMNRNFEIVFPGQPVNYDHMQMIVPDGVHVGALSGTLDKAMEEDLLLSADIQPLDDSRFPGFIDMGVSIKHLAEQGVWLANDNSDGAVLHYNFDGYYLPVELKSGKYYEIEFLPDTRSWLNRVTDVSFPKF